MNKTHKKIRGTKERPRISVFRSNKFLYVQLVDDESGKTVIGLSEKHVKEKENTAKQLGLLLASLAKKKKIEKVVFDRRSYAYHGRIKELAEGAREGGLEF